jgi:hypothetical protein
MNAPSVNKLIVLRRDEGVTSVEALFLLGPRRNVSPDRPLAKNSSLAHCLETVIERRQKIRVLNILPAAGSRVAFHVKWVIWIIREHPHCSDGKGAKKKFCARSSNGKAR